jgi:UDP-N-acetylmuramyl pentapeptide synthase
MPGAPKITAADVEQGLPRAAQVAGRLVVHALGPYTLVDDCYNANSASMRAAIQTLSERARRAGGRLVALLGEMRELGEFAPAEHASVGRAAAELGVAVLAAFGPDAAPIAEAAQNGGVHARHEPSDVDRLLGWFLPALRPKDVILVKGSRGIHMERFIERLRQEIR